MKLRRRRRRVNPAEALERALGQIERQRRFTEAIFDTVDVGLVLLDETGAYLVVNKRHQDFMRLAYPEGHAGLAGQLGQVYAEDGERPLERHEMPTLRAAQGEEYHDVRMWIGDDPLTRRAISVSARSVRDADGTFRGAALAYKDVTDYVRALRVKDQFIATVSHEFRTPLTSIHGYVSMMLEDQGLPAEFSQYLHVVQRNTVRLHRLVSDLLQSAASDHVLGDLVRSPSDVAEIVRAAAESARPAAEHGGVELTVSTPPHVCVLADPQRIAQVVDNLVSNAVKYTLAGGWVRVELVEGADGAVLTVADNGIGIDADDLDRLFARFFRSREAESRSIQGVGLGLSIVKQIVEAHDGDIEVESKPGVGSTFRVRFPVHTLTAADPAPSELAHEDQN